MGAARFAPLECVDGADAAARRGAERIAALARAAAAARGRCTLAASRMRPALLDALAAQSLPWERAHLFQVDERVAPAGDPERNWTDLQARLVARVHLPARHAHPMPVEEPDLAAAARAYQALLAQICGDPPVLDVVHLGLGADGHTASLVPGDAVLEVRDRDVAPTGPYQGRRRLTLTHPALARARAIVWIVTGAEKRDALARLLAGDPSIPASHVRAAHQELIADRAAAG